MPIQSRVQFQPLSYSDFHAIDYEVMGIAFAIHNEMGRFWNEKIYQNELADRYQKAGFGGVATEVPICVSYKDFSKIYKIDLLLESVIYELKTAETFSAEHEKQALNYLMLTGMNHAKLVNMRPPSVQHRFVSTKITPARRLQVTVEDSEWQDLDDDSKRLKQIFKNLLDEWGTFLDITLFYEAVTHFLGGEGAVVKEVEVKNGSRLLGKQKTHLLTQDIAFKISSITKDEKQYESHFRRFLRYTPLKAIHWVNFNHEKVVFKTIFN